MPSPIFRINGGAPGVKASVSAAGAVTATLDSTDGVGSVEWFIDSTDETTEPADYILVQSGSVGQTVDTTALTEGTAAKLRARINGGINRATEQPDPVLTNATAKFFVPTALGREVGVAGEEFESDATYGSTGIINAAVRDTGGVTFADVNAALATANAPIDINGQALTDCGGVKLRNDAGSGTIDGLHRDTGDLVRVGANTGVLGIRLSVATGAYTDFRVNDTSMLRVSATGAEFQTTAAIGIAPAAAGVGKNLSIAAGKGFAGSPGGNLTIAAAEPGTPGSDAYGEVILALGLSNDLSGILRMSAGAQNLSVLQYDDSSGLTEWSWDVPFKICADASFALDIAVGQEGVFAFDGDASLKIDSTGLVALERLHFSGSASGPVYRYNDALTDADATVDVAFDIYQLPTPTANRVIQVRTATAVIPEEGMEIEFTRPAAGAFTWAIHNDGDLANAIVTLDASTQATAKIVFNGTVWKLGMRSPGTTPGPAA